MTEYPPVVIVRELAAPVERVYDAWTKPDNLKQWFYHEEGTVVDSADLDLKVGGSYRVCLHDAESTYALFGKYLRLEPPHLIEFTWQWKSGALEPAETVVTVELTPKGERTELRLTHSRLSSDKSVQAHGAGWLAVLVNLDKYL